MTADTQGATEAPQKQASSKASQPVKKDGSRTRRVKVHRMDGNKHLPITVTVNTRRNRREFWPGQEVELTEQQIGALKDAIVSHNIPISEGSGVYESNNPKAEAMRQNPGWDATVDIASATVFLHKDEPVYVVEYLD